MMPIAELISDEDLKSGSLTPFDGICVVTDDAFENTSIVLVVEANLRFADH